MRSILLAATLAASLAALAQPGPPPGRGPGNGCGPGAGPCYDAETVPGWGMMSSQERAQHQQKMRSMKSYDECVGYMNEQHRQMQDRAKQQGKSLKWSGPAGRGCDYLKK